MQTEFDLPDTSGHLPALDVGPVTAAAPLLSTEVRTLGGSCSYLEWSHHQGEELVSGSLDNYPHVHLAVTLLRVVPGDDFCRDVKGLFLWKLES